MPARLGSALAPRDWLGLQLFSAPPPAQFLPPDSARRDGAGRADQGGTRAAASPASGRGDWGFPSERGLAGIFTGGIRSVGKGS